MKKSEKSSLDIIYNSLVKKAKGYYADEIIEEYAVEDGKEVLLKKKVTKKYVPPDLTASKLIIDYFSGKEDAYLQMSEEDLDKEAKKLIEEYNQMTSGGEIT